MEILDVIQKNKAGLRLVYDADKGTYVLPKLPEKAYIVMPSGRLLPKGMEDKIPLESFLYYDNNDFIHGEPYVNVFIM